MIITDTDTRTHNAKAILTEALDTIRATFWVQSAEVRFAYLDVWDTTDKAVIAALDAEAGYNNIDHYTSEEHDNKVKVVGVCSIGAIALANVTLYDEPLKSFDAIVNRDIETWKAAQALAQAIAEIDSRFLDDSAGASIVNWNDDDGRTREEVIEAFEKALTSPLLEGTEFYQLVGENPRYGDQPLCLFFTSEEKAREFMNTPSELRERALDFTEVDGPEQMTSRKFVHDSMATN